MRGQLHVPCTTPGQRHRLGPKLEDDRPGRIQCATLRANPAHTGRDGVDTRAADVREYRPRNDRRLKSIVVAALKRKPTGNSNGSLMADANPREAAEQMC